MMAQFDTFLHFLHLSLVSYIYLSLNYCFFVVTGSSRLGPLITKLPQRRLVSAPGSNSNEERYESYVLDLWSKFKSYNTTVLNLKKVSGIPNRLLPRQANFPEFISQYFVYKILKGKLLKENVTLNTTKSCADLLINGEFAEVKAGVVGPSSLTIQKK